MRVYVAGPYSADNVLRVLENIRDGVWACKRLLRRGHSPFCPWADFLYVMTSAPGMVPPKEMFYEASLEWLKVADCVLVIGDWTSSEGTMKEIDLATQLGIPIYQDMDKIPGPGGP